jgi:hypothetical protein
VLITLFKISSSFKSLSSIRNLDKTAILSNDLRVNLNLAEEGASLTMTGEDVVAEEESLGLESELESEQDTSPTLQTGQEG